MAMLCEAFNGAPATFPSGTLVDLNGHIPAETPDGVYRFSGSMKVINTGQTALRISTENPSDNDGATLVAQNGYDAAQQYPVEVLIRIKNKKFYLSRDNTDLNNVRLWMVNDDRVCA